MITNAARELLQRAQQAAAVRPGVLSEDLLALINAISLATEATMTTSRLAGCWTSRSRTSASIGDRGRPF
ncbi:hypothetical protein [Nonomuraea sp. NPDC049141]|uniref:SbtR family transcriptional regulator n=1 Tax=Nonomuraea sp. NPDC049141 TaxID=3155500 RepID=UPI0033CCC3DE